MSLAIVHVIAGLNMKYGGPVHSVPGLCDAVSAYGINITLVSQRLLEESDRELIIPTERRVNTVFFGAIKRFGRLHSAQYGHQLFGLLEKSSCNIIHSHGIWLQCNYHAAACAKKLDIPHIISTRGMLAPWAFNHRSWIKRPVWMMWQKRALKQATAFCATSEQEAQDIRMLGFNQPIAVIPNGLNYQAYFEKSERLLSVKKYALFLGRIHPVKGLLDLVRSWAIVKPSGWKVIIAGPDENGHRAKVQNEIELLGMNTLFEFTGPVADEQKDQLYREADLFILPSSTENFGIAIAEALVAGTPVITTKGTPWEGLVTHNCGWWIDIGVDSLADAIRQATSLNDTERFAMGQRGRDYVVREFGWDEVGRKMVAFYDWILNGGAPSDCVRLK